MSKYTKKFSTQAAYAAAQATLELPNVSLITENMSVAFNPYVAPVPKIAGDVYVTDGTSFEIIGKEKYFSDYVNDANVTPIGILVIPADHMTDGKNRIMSLVDMDCATPETGNLTTNATMYWGGVGTDVDTLTNMDKVAAYATVNGTIGIDSYAYLPNESGTYSHTPLAPNPYLSDGSKNPVYFYNTTIDDVDYTYNALSDVAGVSNTDNLIAGAYQQNWQTDTTITNSDGDGYYPAACCVRRFHTPGTSAGDWYLPACGELGYVYPRFTTINDTLNRLNNAGKVAVRLTYMYWSSTEYSDYCARAISMEGGYIADHNKNLNIGVRAFLSV